MSTTHNALPGTHTIYIVFDGVPMAFPETQTAAEIKSIGCQLSSTQEYETVSLHSRDAESYFPHDPMSGFCLGYFVDGDFFPEQ